MAKRTAFEYVGLWLFLIFWDSSSLQADAFRTPSLPTAQTYKNPFPTQAPYRARRDLVDVVTKCPNVQSVDGNSGTVQITKYGPQLNCLYEFKPPSGSIVKLTFDLFDTECGWDFVDVVEDDIVLGHLCGLRPVADGWNDVFVSKTVLSMRFYSDTSVNSAGIIARYQYIASNQQCATSADCNGLSCTSGICVCDQLHRGAFCELDTTSNANFTARKGHSAAYDSTSDIMYITYGENAITVQDTLFKYRPATDTWAPLDGIGSPGRRAEHFTFVTDQGFLLFGGRELKNNRYILYSDVWMYFADSKLWIQLMAPKGSPEGTGGSAVAFVKETRKLYVVGGSTAAMSTYNMVKRAKSSRCAFFNADTRIWRELRAPPAGVYGGTMVHHGRTNTLHLYGGTNDFPVNSLGRPAFVYSIDADLWYYGPRQSEAYTGAFASALSAGDDVMLITGGYRWSFAADAGILDCFTNMIKVVDLACGTIDYRPGSFGARRYGHTSSIINNGTTLALLGGSNGILLNDMMTLPLSTLQPNGTRSARNTCARRQWCSIAYDCNDCVARSYCGWCGNSCVFIGGGSSEFDPLLAGSCSSPNVLINRDDKCPARVLINFSNGPIKDSIKMFAIKEYKLYVDRSNGDLTFQIKSDQRLNMSLPFLQPTFSSISGQIVIPFSDTRVVGFYVIRISFPNAPIGRRASDDTIVNYELTVTQSRTNGDADGGSSGFKIDIHDIMTFVMIFVSSVLLSLSTSYMVRRTRERLRLLRLLREGELVVIPKEPPRIFEVEMDISGILGYSRVSTAGIRSRATRVLPEHDENERGGNASTTSRRSHVVAREPNANSGVGSYTLDSNSTSSEKSAESTNVKGKHSRSGTAKEAQDIPRGSDAARLAPLKEAEIERGLAVRALSTSPERTVLASSATQYPLAIHPVPLPVEQPSQMPTLVPATGVRPSSILPTTAPLSPRRQLMQRATPTPALSPSIPPPSTTRPADALSSSPHQTIPLVTVSYLILLPGASMAAHLAQGMLPPMEIATAVLEDTTTQRLRSIAASSDTHRSQSGASAIWRTIPRGITQGRRWVHDFYHVERLVGR
ncbi:hypothetical protein DFS34DRAFT_665189 [Phlyctochytrium arcticum]|nr:hypothetical protein DFS34DRAFT_665189 [Phlyctochytrium arcticum]